MENKILIVKEITMKIYIDDSCEISHNKNDENEKERTDESNGIYSAMSFWIRGSIKKRN